jgi:TP901 family phage tail tape measure protein
MAESALVYANVGDDVDVETGSQSIISTMKAFGVEANNTMSIVDKFNEIGNNFAITTKGIGDALQVSASAMAAAGNTLDETIALTTAANTIVQNPNTVGTALKTLSLRTRGVKTELEEAGLETEGMAETTSQLQAKLKALTGGKVDIMLDANTFKSTTQILREMSEVWDKMVDKEQAAALELLGGKRQANILAALINNFDIVEDAIGSSENSAGSALKENEKVLDSIQGRINQFNNALQTFWNNLLDSDVIKFFITLGTEIIKLASAFGEVRTVIFAILMYFNMSKKYPFDLAKWIFGPKGISNILNGLSKIKSSLNDLSKTKPINFTNPDSTSGTHNTPKTPPPSSPTGGYARLGAGIEPTDLNEAFSAKFSRMWQNHISRLRDSVNRVKQDFTDIWQHHNERVAGSMQYASTQFNKLKASASTVWTSISQAASNAANNIKSKLGRTSVMSAGSLGTHDDNTRQPVGALGSASKTKKVATEVGRIWKAHIANLKRNYESVKDTFSTIWGHHQERVTASMKAASAQLNAFKKKFTNMQIPQWAKNAANGFKNFFGGAIAWVQNGFSKFGDFVGKIFTKIKTTAHDTAQAFKERLGYVGKTTSAESGATNQADISTIFQGAERSGEKLSLGGDIDAITAKINELNSMDDAGVLNYIKTINDMGDAASDTDKALAAYASTTKAGGYSTQEANAFVQQHNASVKASGFAAKAAAVGHMALNAALSMGISLLISGAISAITSLIDKHKELAEAAEEALDAYTSATKTLKDHYDTIEDIKEDYAELADGVDSLGRNVSLSTDEYKQYNEIVNKIADMFPEMVSGYTAEGNAIIGLKGNVEELTKAYEREAQAARDAILVSQNDVFKNFKNNTTEDDFWSGVSKLDEKKFFEDILSGTRISADFWNADYDQGNGEATVDSWLENAGIDTTTWFSSYDKFNEEIDKHLPQIQAYYRQLTTELEAEATGVRSILNAYLEQDFEYAKLSDEAKKVAQAIVSSFDTEFYSQFESAPEMEAWVTTHLIEPLQDANNIEKINIAFDLQTQFNNGDIPVDDYIAQITEFTELLKTLGFDEEIVKTVKGVFHIEDYETKKNSAMEILDAEGDQLAGTLTKEDLDIIDKNKTEWKKELEIDGKTTMSWDNLNDKIAEAKEMAWEASESFENISKGIDGIQDAYSTLNDVVKEYNENGFLSLDNLQALLSLEPEYLACLQMENGQLSINQQALRGMVQARLAEAKATVVQNAMDQLHTLAARTEADAVTDSATAASNAVGGLGEYANALGIVSQDAIRAAGAVTAFKSAIEGAKDNKFVDPSEIDAILSSMNTQLEMIDKLGSNLSTNFNAIMGNNKSDTHTGGSGSGDSALDRIKNKYEGEISNLENQQTYIQNEIDRLEAKNEAVSKSYYEEQIAREQDKLDLYTKEGGMLDELRALYEKNPTNETAQAIWEIEHAIQESTLRMIEFRQSIIDLYKTGFDDMVDAYGNKEALLSDRQSYIDKYREFTELQGGVATASMYESQIATEEQKKVNNLNKLHDLRAALQTAMHNGLKEGSDEWIAMQEEIRATEAAILDNKIAIEQYKDELKQLSVESFNLVRNAFSNKGNFLTNQQDYVQGYIDLLEAQGIDVPVELYEKLISIEEDKRENLVKDLTDKQYGARKMLADIEAKGFTAADEEWQDAYGKVVELEKAIQDCDIATAQWEKALRDLDFEKFERFTNRLDNINSELEHVRDLLSDEDVAFEDGSWTEEGITSLGVLYHQMQLAQQQSKQYADKIQDLTNAYKRGEMSEQEYYERLQELKEGQWSAIELYEDTKDAMIDMEEARIDMIEEGINKEIEAYQELIDLKKEELDAERDLYDFKKNVQKQTKDIASLERRIAALSGSTNASDIAERRRLEAQLRESQEGLNDTYYSHAKDQQNKALDDEMTSYQDAKDKYLETLRDTLDNTEQIISQKISEFLLNADVGLETLNGISTTHGITLSSELLRPWQSAAAESTAFKSTAEANLNGLVNEDGVVTFFGTDAKAKLEGVFGAGGSAAQEFQGTVADVVNNVKLAVEQSTSPLTQWINFPWNNATKEDGPLSTFDKEVNKALNTAIKKAQDNVDTMKDSLSKPWEHATSAAKTFGRNSLNVLTKVIDKAGETYAALSKLANVDTPSYIPSENPPKEDTTRKRVPGSTPTPTTNPSPTYTKVMHKTGTLGQSFIVGSQDYFDSQCQTINGAKYYARVVTDRDGKSTTYYYKASEAEKRRYDAGGRSVGLGFPAGTSVYKYYAKGTMGTSKSQWAITDEPWLGDELTLVPTAQGNLSYMRKGTSVVPADITENLVKWGQLNPDMTSVTEAIHGINLMSNVVNKPETNLSFDALLHIDNCTKEVLPEVQKLVNDQLDKFARKLNYSLKKVGAT